MKLTQLGVAIVIFCIPEPRLATTSIISKPGSWLAISTPETEERLHRWKVVGCDWTRCCTIPPGLPFPGKGGPEDLPRSLPTWAVLWSLGAQKRRNFSVEQNKGIRRTKDLIPPCTDFEAFSLHCFKGVKVTKSLTGMSQVGFSSWHLHTAAGYVLPSYTNIANVYSDCWLDSSV